MKNAELADRINAPRDTDLLLTWKDGEETRLGPGVWGIHHVGVGVMAIQPVDGDFRYVRWWKMIWPSTLASVEEVT